MGLSGWEGLVFCRVLEERRVGCTLSVVVEEITIVVVGFGCLRLRLKKEVVGLAVDCGLYISTYSGSRQMSTWLFYDLTMVMYRHWGCLSGRTAVQPRQQNLAEGFDSRNA